MNFDQIVSNALPPESEATKGITFQCPVSLHKKFNDAIATTGANRTTLLVGAIEGLVAALSFETPPATLLDKELLDKNE